jgi:hypothetical protein
MGTVVYVFKRQNETLALASIFKHFFSKMHANARVSEFSPVVLRRPNPLSS